jgi:flagellar basal-body rod modification protein FlgD
MSFTTPTTSATTTTPTAGTAAAGKTSSLPVTQNQFLQMMMAELKNQNPMSPNSSDPMQFVTELAQFTSLEQQVNTAQSTSTIASGQSTASAIALIGHTVNYIDPTTGAQTSGSVQSVQLTSSGPTLTIGGTSGISPSAVYQVS